MPFCRVCGTDTESLHRYCRSCGAEAGTGATAMVASGPHGAVLQVDDDDVVGIGRYILSFFLAGLIGLAIQYGLRNKGWTATWINAVIFLVVVTMVVAAG